MEFKEQVIRRPEKNGNYSIRLYYVFKNIIQKNEKYRTIKIILYKQFVPFNVFSPTTIQENNKLVFNHIEI